MRWSTVQASELMLKRGGSVNPVKFPEETFELFSIPAYDSDQPEILSGKDIGSSKSCIEPNDVLLSKIVPHIRRCWVVTDRKEHRQIGSGEWIIFRDERFYPQFLKHFLTSDGFHHQFMNTVAGVGGSLVRARPAFVEKIQIPLPPLDEQKRIAAILDKADTIRRKRQQAIDLADDFLRSVFLDMFGDPVTNPKGWEVKPLNSFVSKLGDGLHGTPNYDSNGEYFFVNGNNLIDGKIITNENTKKVNEEEYQKHKKELNDTTMLVSINGTIGKVAFYNGEKVVLGKSACYFNLLPDSISAVYIYHLIQSHYFFHYVGSVVTGSTIKNVSLKSMREFPVPVPSVTEQTKFEQIAMKIEDSKSKLLSSLQGAEDNFNSLSQKAFAGEL